MEKERLTHNMISVLDLKIIDSSDLEELASARIVFVFDHRKNVRQFSIVDSKMPHEFQDKLRTWLEKNIDLSQITGAMNSNIATVKADGEAFGNPPSH